MTFKKHSFSDWCWILLMDLFWKTELVLRFIPNNLRLPRDVSDVLNKMQLCT